ncbi:DUF3800 domain-containing protein [Candidatus Ferrigenium straubiae]|jgi:hypothetical protein|uniref:DUF3800 domain-containing protein n=1 Tax=Candidatus Ferrigenium straubiae TaxID=2919506 RepID=UPI003F4ACABE
MAIQADEMRQKMMPLRNWDKPFSMFYDETNNIRRLTLSEVGLNSPENRNFILAGIVLHPGQHLENIDTLRATLRIQANAPEIKFKHVAHGDYEAILASRGLNSFLAWLLDEGILIHYSQLNVLYWALIDIVESLMPGNAFGINEYHTHLKSELYDVVSRSPAEFMSLLHSYTYPNVDRSKISAFLGAVSDFLVRHSPENRNDGTILLKHTLRQAIGLNELVFLHDNEPGELIRDFSMHFLRSVYVFKSASHTFDHETNIEKILQSVEVLDGQRRVAYRFVDSKDNVCVQLSDIVAGLMGKHFNYVQDNSLATLKARKSDFTALQRHNLAMLRELIDRSDAVSDGFCHTIAPLDCIFKNNAFLHDQDAPRFIP